MSEYLRTISKISNGTEHNKSIKIADTILNYYFYFNKLGENINRQMKMKSHTKNLILLGNFKIIYDKHNLVFNKITFKSENNTFVLVGSFMRVNDAIVYYKHKNICVR